MKYSKFLFCPFFTLCFSCCKTAAKIESVTSAAAENNSAAALSGANTMPIASHSYLAENEIGKPVTVTGLLTDKHLKAVCILFMQKKLSRLDFLQTEQKTFIFCPRAMKIFS